MTSLKKIVVIGPESTGKSTLCKELADRYNTLWVPEYAREYLETNGMDYNYDDLLTIAQEQIISEEQYANIKLKNHRQQPNNLLSAEQSFLFIDTDMYVMKVWCEFVFGKCHNWILNQIAKRQYDLYLLCNVDLPWTKDNLREYPNFEIRNKLYRYYQDIMINQSTPWIEIEGNYLQRSQKAIDGINSLLS
jgi:NadR type nicotinamide-nucleotide adenylyltransferase